jgi:hypothetical protein
MGRVENLEETHAGLQTSLDSWTRLLIATGGALKPEKCCSYLMGFNWDRQGTWSHAKLEENPTFKIAFYLPNRWRAPIEHLSVNEARVTLGMSSCPSGKADNLLAKEKADAAPSTLVLMQEKL